MKSIQEAVASVQNAFPSIYTKDDVVKLLESIEIPAASSGAVFSRETIENLIEAVKSNVEKTLNNIDASDAIDHDSAEFEIGYRNVIELQSVDINTSGISDEVETAVEDAINEFFEEGGFVKDEDDIVELERAESTHDEHSIS